MPRWNARERQRMVDEYLNATGRNLFTPQEFLGWLRDKPNHALHGLFFGRSDEELAQAMREDMVRRWVSGLRIIVHDTTPEVRNLKVVVHEMPAMVSPVAGRKTGGGYVPMDPTNPEMLAEVARQGATALDAWLGRYRGVAAARGVDVTPIEEIAALLAGGVVQSAA